MTEEDARVVWCGNLSEFVTEDILYELFLQAGPLEKVIIPKGKEGRQKNFAFITYNHQVSVPYAIELFRGTALFNRSLTLQSRVKSNPDQNRQVGNNTESCNYNGHEDRVMRRHDDFRQERSYQRSHPYRREDYHRNDKNEPRHNMRHDHNRNNNTCRRKR